MKVTFHRLLRSAEPPRALPTQFYRWLPRSCIASTRNFSVGPVRKQDEEGESMAPKVPKFELKTPKGTKDCERGFLILLHSPLQPRSVIVLREPLLTAMK